MRLQPKIADSEANPAFPDATPAAKAPQLSGPENIASLAGSPVAAVGSPALALQQQLVERMAELLNGNGEDSAVDEPAKWSMPVSLAVIVGASASLWLAIGVIVAQII